MLYSSQHMHVHKVSFVPCSLVPLKNSILDFQSNALLTELFQLAEEFHFMIKIREVAIKLISYYTAKETRNKVKRELREYFQMM